MKEFRNQNLNFSVVARLPSSRKIWWKRYKFRVFCPSFILEGTLMKSAQQAFIASMEKFRKCWLTNAGKSVYWE